MTTEENNGRETMLVGLIKQLGVPTAILVILLAFLGYLFRWSASNVAEPLIQSHRDFLHTLADEQRKQSQSMNSLTDSFDSIGANQRQQTEILQQNQAIMKGIADSVSEHRKAMEKK